MRLTDRVTPRCWLLRRCPAVLATVLLIAPPSLAFKTPLSSEAVREAYFLGQRHDGSYERLLGEYVKQLPPPKSGPYFSSVELSTPFLQMIEYSSRQSNYNAQQAALDYHRFGKEIVRVVVEIRLTQSYGQFVATTNSQSDATSALVPRPHDFWKQFKVQVYNSEGPLSPSASRGHANSSCGRAGCALIGATIELEFPATAFASDSATIEVDPPEGDRVSVNFDLSSIR
ncbi:MAG: hypothetical protein DMG41_32270 [Acidobacteria bacterium]|nr:MAG: hypothetical protein DMG42_16880 [Acidobacteriota bacterium]PYT82995.1 MAG: hypothetical protein DMG41_32270 [Acidobacteriota bacterium]